ncbi:MAG: DUF4345 family protein [Hyphomonadaceae bacterium]
MPWTHYLAIAASLVGALIGGYAMMNPAWASRVVRLVPTPGQAEGRSEFRATFGGLFFAAHAFAGWALVSQVEAAPWAAATLGVGWLGSCFGRSWSLFADKTFTWLNLFNVAFDLVFGVALLGPLVSVTS